MHCRPPHLFLSKTLASLHMLLIALSFSLFACATNPDNEQPRPDHHKDGGFRNNYSFIDPSLLDFLEWRRQRLVHMDRSEPEDLPDPVTDPAVDYLASNHSEVSLTFIGHASVLLQMNGLNILADPVFSDRASPLGFAGPKRHQPPGLTTQQLPHIHAVVVSHSHYDHLDRPSIRQLCEQPGGPPVLMMPLKLDDWVRQAVPECDEARVEGLDWWQEALLGEVRFILTPVQHWSQRTPFDRNQTLWGGWALVSDDFRFWFSGDLGYSQDIPDIGERLGPFDLAAIAIGDYQPRWFMSPQHIDPHEAVITQQEIRADRAVGIHWGTFRLADEPLDQPPKDLAKAREKHGVPDHHFITMVFGETRRWDGSDLVPLSPSSDTEKSDPVTGIQPISGSVITVDD
ncbi:MAG: MBL fold metallo-hydrolase [Halomonadaceae bacterium]|nr:MAG: MBL fold metallo-hydrolase [Halomonadaceae bacterium]